MQLAPDGGEFVFGYPIGGRVEVEFVFDFGHEEWKVVCFEFIIEPAAK